MTAIIPKLDSALRLARNLIAAGKRARADGQPFGEEQLAAVIRIRDEQEFGQAKRSPRISGRNPLFDAFAMATGARDLSKLTRTGCKVIGIALAEIREVCPSVTEEEIRRVVDAYKKKHPTWPCTPMAISSHWAEFTQSRTTRSAELDPYVEPSGWKDVLKEIGSTWDREYMREAMMQSWQQLSFVVRIEVVKEIQRRKEIRHE